MTTHYLFLRGINVAGVRVGMPELRETLTSLGATDVRTWLATGNVRLEWEGGADELKAGAEAALSERFGYEAYVLLRSAGDLTALVATFPYPAADDAHRYVVFGGASAWGEIEPTLASTMTSSDTVSPDQAQIAGEELLWRCPKGASTTSAVAKVLAKKRYKAATTTRNLNTIEKMLR